MSEQGNPADLNLPCQERERGEREKFMHLHKVNHEEWAKHWGSLGVAVNHP